MGSRKERKIEAPMSQRSTRELKSGRQKVGRSNRTKLNKYLHEANKENCSIELNCLKVLDDEKSLACIRSETGLTAYHQKNGARKHSVDVPTKI